MPSYLKLFGPGFHTWNPNKSLDQMIILIHCISLGWVFKLILFPQRHKGTFHWPESCHPQFGSSLPVRDTWLVHDSNSVCRLFWFTRRPFSGHRLEHWGLESDLSHCSVYYYQSTMQTVLMCQTVHLVGAVSVTVSARTRTVIWMDQSLLMFSARA